MSMQYFCVIADLIDSRSLPDRREFQRILGGRLKEVSEGSSGLVSPYTITLGDEFQAVYSTTENIFSDLFRIIWEIWPQKIRVAIGCGSIDTDINTKSALGMDGPAFHTARSTMMLLKKNSYTTLAISGMQSSDKELAGAILATFSKEFKTWKRTSVGVFCRLINGAAIPEISHELGVSDRMVYKTIASNKMREYLEIFYLVAARMME